MVPATELKAVLFDMDGVLVHSYHAWFALMNALAKELGCPPIAMEAFHPTWGQGPEADARMFFGGCPTEQVEAWYDAHLVDHVAEVEIDGEGPPLFGRLRSAGLALAVVTNTPSGAARAVLEHAGLAPDALVGPDLVARAKPAPDMVLEALRRLGVPPGRAVMVGDSPFDGQAAEAAGVAFVRYRAGEGTLQRLRDLPEVLGLPG